MSQPALRLLAPFTSLPPQDDAPKPQLILAASQRAYVRWHAHNMNSAVLEAFDVAQYGQRLSPNTIRNRGSLLRGPSTAASAPLLHLTTRHIRSHIGRTGISPGTARTELCAFRAFYSFAVSDGYLELDPTKGVDSVRVPKGEPRPFAREQIEAMLAGGAYRRTRIMILVGYLQGFLVSQIARVRGVDIDYLTNTIRTISKGGKERRVPLHPMLREISETMPTGWWFPARDGRDRPIQPSSVTDLITKAKIRAGIHDRKLTPHSLRHGFATDLVDRGVDIRIIQELLLHEDISSTQIYTAVSARRKDEAIRRIEHLTLPSRTKRPRVAA